MPTTSFSACASKPSPTWAAISRRSRRTFPMAAPRLLPGVYDFPACHARMRAAFTNTLPVDAYRGAGRPEAAYVIERLVDVAARELGVGADALRKKNFIKPKQMPYTTPTEKVYDSGEFAAHMARAQEVGDWDGFRKRHADSRKAKKLRGIGMATYIEVCGGAGPQLARVNLERRRYGESRDRLAVDRAGPSDRLCAACRRTSRSAAGEGHGRPGRHRLDPDRFRHRRIELDPGRRRFGVAGLEETRRESSRSSPPTRSKPAPAILRFPRASVRIVGTDRAISFGDIAKNRRSRICSRPKMRGRRSRPIRTAPISSRSRSIRTPAASRS